ncbi:MAG: AMP-binding protein, partial [Algicola sp.]|nr:AMP-binding protein [Algicola sp.]
LDYWQQQLKDVDSLALPCDFARPAQQQYQGKELGFEFDRELSQQLRTVAKAQKTTLNTVLLSGFYITLAGLCGQSDIVVGMPSDNRQPQTRSLIGLFVNSLALRAQVDVETSIERLIKQVHSTVIGAKAHQALPFEKLVEALGVERDASRHPVYQVMFSWQQNNESFNKDLPFKPMQDLEGESLFSPAKFDLSLFVGEKPGRLGAVLNYAEALFEPSTIERIAALYQRVLTAMVADTQQTVGNIDLLSAVDRTTLLHQPTVMFNTEQTLCEQFEQQVKNHPDKIALVFESESLSYRELDQKANQMAHFIGQHHQFIGQQQPLVGLYMHRSIEMIVAMLAVLKAGGAYVPISPDIPMQRTQFIVGDTQMVLAVTQQCYIEKLDNALGGLPLLVADNEVIDSQPTVPLTTASKPAGLKPTDLAYVIYTSGTTGNPKGVMIEQRSVLNYAKALDERLGENFERIDFSANYCFDLSVTTSLCPLLLGRSVYIYEGDIREVADYHQHLARHNIGFVKTTPSLARVLLSHTAVRVKTLMLGGEALTQPCIDDLAPNVDTIFDEYGPTEATVGVMLSQVWPQVDSGIGKPYPNVQVYNLNSAMQLVPIGAPGELYIGGAGLARGYL